MIDAEQKADKQRTLSLLLVEDNDVDARVVERLVRKLHHDVRVIRVRNGEEALSVILEDWSGTHPFLRPLATLVDINMPRMDGLELLAELDKRSCSSPHGPIFMLTTSSNPLDQKAVSGHERVGEYIVKPLDAQTLQRIVDIALEQDVTPEQGA